jgi:hypothetical protein
MRLFSQADTQEMVIIKGYAAVGTAIAGRTMEIHAVCFGDIKRVVDEDGVPAYHVEFDRVKKVTSNTTERETANLACGLGVKALDTYLACFPKAYPGTPEERKKEKLWRRLSLTRNHPTATWKAQPVGRDKCKKFGIVIATALDLFEPSTYTGHCWRRSAATLAANAGLSLAQIKALTGHRSDTVVQRYIDRSLPMMLAAANGTSISGPAARDPDHEPSSSRVLQPITGSNKRRLDQGAFRPHAPANPNYNINVTITGNVSGSLGLFQQEQTL